MMRLKLLFLLFLISDCVFVRVQSQSDDYSYRKRLAASSRITGGEKYESKDQLDHPWLVGLHNRLSESFFCAGSLISNRHVLSAAHCFHEKGDALATDPYHVMAMLGRFNVSDHDEAGSLNSLVWEIFIHPDWNFNRVNYDADISIVVLEDLVEFTAFIRPVRLPQPSNKIEVNGDGTVVGWGKDSNSSKFHEETPNKIEVPAVLFKDCVLDAPKLLGAQSRRTFCAGFSGRAIAACAGDSGGGFYIEDSSAKISIEGIVSSSIQDTPGVCKTDIYTTYTIVANFVPWIKEKVQETKQKVVKDVNYNCDFRVEDKTCEAERFQNPSQNSVRFKLRDFRGDPKVDTYVRILRLNFGKTRVIEGISETFPNLEELKSDSIFSNRIERRTFANMTKLKKLDIERNELVTYRYFDDLVNLEELRMANCRMPKQPRNLFNALKNLKSLSMSGGNGWRALLDETLANMTKLETLILTYIRLGKIPENAFKDLVGLKSLQLNQNLITKLPAGLFENLRSLKSINLAGNEIAELSRELFANNLMLEEIDLDDNKIKTIKTDFTALPKIRSIWLWGNVCVSAAFGYGSYMTVQELQQMIETQCKRK